jgi:hypothetical protein
MHHLHQSISVFSISRLFGVPSNAVPLKIVRDVELNSKPSLVAALTYLSDVIPVL